MGAIPTRMMPMGVWTPPLPYDAEIEYLESTGTQYIDTGIAAESDGWVHAKAECAEGYRTQQPFGIDTQNSSYGTAQRRLLLVMDNKYDGKTVSSYIDRGNVSNSRIPFGAVSPVDTGKRLFSLPLTDTRRHLLFTSWPLPGGPNKFHGKIYFFRLWDGDDNLVLDMIPVRVGSVGYFYDRVTRQLFGNKGANAFILGPDVT
jgi:hypothetical protein